MASSGDTRRKYYACDLVAFNDTELDQYLEEHRLEGGASLVEVEDPENLTEEFIQRLRDRSQQPSVTDQSRQVDLDQVNNHLLKISSSKDSSPQPRSTSPSSEISYGTTQPATPREVYEQRYYNELVKAGGRPLYQINDLDDAAKVVKDPAAHHEMLRPWLEYPDVEGQWRVFKDQLHHWLDFRDWQANNRRSFRPTHAIPDMVYMDFTRHFRSVSKSYEEAFQNLLADYGFSWSIHLLDEPEKQDKLTTWIEYLGYACAAHFRYVRLLERLQPIYDKAWKKLADSNVLRSFETEDFVNSTECAYKLQGERVRAIHAVMSLEADLARTIEDEQISGIPGHKKPITSNNSAAVQSELDKENKLLASYAERSERVSEFHITILEYKTARRQSKRHKTLVQWISEQVPLVEKEMNDSTLENTHSNGFNSSDGTRSQDAVETHSETTSKEQQDSHGLGSTSSSTRPNLKRSYDRTNDDESASNEPEKLARSECS